MRKLSIIILMIISALSCKNSTKSDEVSDNFEFLVDQFADLRILRYQVTDFDELDLKQKKLIYYLSQAALCGRDILFDQNGKYNLAIRRTLESVYESYHGNREGEQWGNFMIYLKRVWFSNGIYHHYSTEKIQPGFTSEYFNELCKNSNFEPLLKETKLTKKELLDLLTPVIFNPEILPKKVCQNTEMDLITNSAVNFYGEGVTQKEVESYYLRLKDKNNNQPPSWGLNTKVVSEKGKLKEIQWKLGGMYSSAIDKIIFWLQKAETVAENKEQKEIISKLIAYYRTGDLKTFDEYNIQWLKDTISQVDFINGFIEVYNDPMGLKGSWESVVNFKNIQATERTETISKNAQWFEINSPVDKRFKKQEVKGVTAKVITVAQLGGDCYPATPIGINLPNSDWIRKEYGSKSVSIENISFAYDQAGLKTGFLEEFSFNQDEIDLIKKYGYLVGNLHTDLHECLGHGSGQLLPGISSDALKNYHSTIEETRADLFALYYLMDPKLVELGLLPNLEAAKTEYISYIRNGLMTQLTRIEFGKDLEQAHMRDRQLISGYCFENGKQDNVIEMIKNDGKTYFKINDFAKLRSIIADLLKEVQRIKSEGDYEAAKNLVETYGVKVDRDIHKEVLDRYKKLKLAPYTGFINPDFIISEKNGEIQDIKICYSNNYLDQMVKYSKNYSYLPTFN